MSHLRITGAVEALETLDLCRVNNMERLVVNFLLEGFEVLSAF